MKDLDPDLKVPSYTGKDQETAFKGTFPFGVGQSCPSWLAAIERLLRDTANSISPVA